MRDKADTQNSLLRNKLEEIYMQQPMGLEQQGRSEAPLVCGLLKCMYGLKHSGILWYDKRCEYLKEQTNSDTYVPTRKKARQKELAGTWLNIMHAAVDVRNLYCIYASDVHR